MRPSFDSLRAIAPGAPAPWLTALVNIDSKRWGLTTKERWAGFIGQILHETNQFLHLEELLSYSADRLMHVWPKRFPDKVSAAPYARNPEKLANKVYANRMGNGDEASGDGWRFRGRGPVQLTGRENYLAASLAIGVDLVLLPQRVFEPSVGMDVAGWFWQSHGCNELADQEDHAGISKKINGGSIGLEDRIHWVNLARDALLTASTGL